MVLQLALMLTIAIGFFHETKTITLILIPIHNLSN